MFLILCSKILNAFSLKSEFIDILRSTLGDILTIPYVLHFPFFLDSQELGSASVSVNIFNYISKLFNIPLLSVATSFVAEDISRSENNSSASGKFNALVIYYCIEKYCSKLKIEIEMTILLFFELIAVQRRTF